MITKGSVTVATSNAKDFGVDVGVGLRCPGWLYVLLVGRIGPYVASTLLLISRYPVDVVVADGNRGALTSLIVVDMDGMKMKRRGRCLYD